MVKRILAESPGPDFLDVGCGTGIVARQFRAAGANVLGVEEVYTRDEWLDQVPTSGGHSRFPPPELEELLAGIGAVIDRAGGSFVMRYATVVVTAVRSSVTCDMAPPTARAASPSRQRMRSTRSPTRRRRRGRWRSRRSTIRPR